MKNWNNFYNKLFAFDSQGYNSRITIKYDFVQEVKVYFIFRHFVVYFRSEMYYMSRIDDLFIIFSINWITRMQLR